jgi:hypothetical protein
LFNTTSMDQPVETEPIISDSVRIRVLKEWYQQLSSKAARSVSRTAKSLAAKRTAKARWAKRRIRYGPSGLKLREPGYLSKKYPHSKSSWPDPAEQSPST